jgi:hypothetical protein
MPQLVRFNVNSAPVSDCLKQILIEGVELCVKLGF